MKVWNYSKTVCFVKLSTFQGKLIKSKCIHGSLISRRKVYLKNGEFWAKIGHQNRWLNDFQLKMMYSDQKISKVWQSSYFAILKILTISQRSFFEIYWSPILEFTFFHYLVRFQFRHITFSLYNSCCMSYAH